MNSMQIKKQIRRNHRPLIIAGACVGAAALAAGLVKGIKGMKASAKARHEVDKAEYAAAKAEAKAAFAEAKAKGRASAHQQMMQEECVARIQEANKRKTLAEARSKVAGKRK